MEPSSKPGRGTSKEPAPAVSRRPVDREEKRIIRRCQEGSETAFKNLFERYQRRAYAVAYNILNDGDLARDVVQEAFIRVFRNIHRFDPARNFYTWLYQIVVNLSIDFLRKRASHRAAPLGDLGDSVEGTGRGRSSLPSVAQEDTRRRVAEALDVLPSRYRVVLTLRDIEGFSCEEIAEIVHCKNSTVRWRIHQARKLFKAVWSGEGTDEVLQEEDPDEL